MTDSTKQTLEAAQRQALEAALEEILGAVASLSLEYAVSVSKLVRMLRKQCVEQAQRMPTPDGINPRAPNILLTATRTGLTRREVKRIMDQELVPHARGTAPKIRETLHRGERVIAGWRNDLYFQEGGKPRDLPVLGPGPTFAELCRRHTPEARHRTILQDLLRVCAVSILPNHRVRLERTTYAPAGQSAAGLAAMGTQVRELLETHLHNFLHPDEQQICVRVSNPYVRQRFAPGLVRDATSQLRVVSKLADGALNNPEVTGSPEEARAAEGGTDALESISVTCFIRRAPSPTSPTSASDSPSSAPGSAPAAKSRRRQKRTR